MTADARQADRLHRAAWRMERGLDLPPVIDRDDIAQEQAIAEMLARVNLDATRSAGEQATYLLRRRRGAAIDAMRSARDKVPTVRLNALQEGAAASLGETLAVAGDQHGQAAVVRACRAALTLRDPLPLLFASLLAGATPQHLATHLGVSALRINRHLDELRKTLAQHLGVA